MLIRMLFAVVLYAVVLLNAAAPVSAKAPVVQQVAYHATYFDTEAAAQQHCPRDVVVWLNVNSGVYHYKGERWYGRTRHGAYMCEKEAIAEGDRASRNGQ